MTKLDNVYDMRSEDPFIIYFKNGSIKRVFLEHYRPGTGFGILKTKGYSVYIDSYVFETYPYQRKGEPVTGIVLTKYSPIKQIETIESAVKRVQVVGMMKDYFCILGNRKEGIKGDPTPDITRNGVEKLLRILEDNQKNLQGKGAEADANDEVEVQLAFLEKHEETIKAKQEFDEKSLFTVAYTEFDDALQNAQDGILYKFKIEIPKDAKEGKKAIASRIKENTGVEVSSNDGGKKIPGTIIEGDDEWISIKFHKSDESYTRIASRGEITERSNPEYRFKSEALQLLRSGNCPNKYLLDIIASHKVRPYREITDYTPHAEQINESQINAVRKALSVEDFLLVQGPPGTGKTTIITEMIENFVRDGKKILVCSKNNLAVDNVLEKCKDLYYDAAGTHKMQCLRLGNEEKVIEEVRGLLPRPLTQRIQDDVKQESENYRRDYMDRSQQTIQKYEAAKRDTKDLCVAIQYFINGKRIAQNMLNDFRSSIMTFMLGKAKKETFLKALVLMEQEMTAAIDELTALLQKTDALVSPEMIEGYLQHAHNTFDAMELLGEEIRKYGIRYWLIFGGKKGTILNTLEAASEYGRDKLLTKICDLRSYTGNPAADLMPAAHAGSSGWTLSDVDNYSGKIDQRIEEETRRQVKFKGIIDEWHDELQNDQASLEEPLLRTVKIIGATCIGANTNRRFRNAEYDIAIVDEAGQITMHDLLVPLVKARKIILIGDHLQLPPSEERDFCDQMQEEGRLASEYADSDELNKVFSESLFEELFKEPAFSSHRAMLDTQFRMHPDIAEFISEYFYDGKYRSGVTAESRSLSIAGFTKPLYFLDTKRLKDHYEDENSDDTIHTNKCEARVIAEKIAGILVRIERGDYEMPEKKLKRADGSYDIGIITAYKAQIPIIRKYIKENLEKEYSAEDAGDMSSRLAINTLDSFQGRDNQIIFYSFVRSNDEKNIGFLNEVRRLNVMMTRAKSLLVMVGDSRTLTGSRSKTIHDGKDVKYYYGGLIEYCKRKGGYVELSEEVQPNEKSKN